MNLNSLDTRILIIDSGITQKTIAATMGITPEYLSRCLQKGITPKMQECIERAIKKIKGEDNRVLKIEEFLPRHYWLEFWYYTDENTDKIEANLHEVYVTGEGDDGIDTSLVDSPLEVFSFEFEKYNRQEPKGWRIWYKKPDDADRKKTAWNGEVEECV